MSLSRKVLTIYTDRGWSDSDRRYNETSVARGYASLNAHVHRLIRDNPKLTVHSVSHSSILQPAKDKWEHTRTINLFATIVYSGEIEHLSQLQITNRLQGPSTSDPTDIIDFNDDYSGQGTIIKIEN